MLKIVTYPNDVLSNPAKDVTFPLDNATKKLIQDMWDTVKNKGVGLAAPQVGVSKRICIIHMDEDVPKKKNGGKQPKNLDFVMINPRITFSSQLENLLVEGCLSFPGEFYEIWRPANIIVEFFDEKGKKQTLKANGWLARIIQHEVDHLDGKLFINLGGRKIEEKDVSSKDVVD